MAVNRERKMYRVVEASWVGSGRVEKDIGCKWKSERLAKEEMKQMNIKNPGRTYSIQPKDRK